MPFATLQLPQAPSAHHPASCESAPCTARASQLAQLALVADRHLPRPSIAHCYCTPPNPSCRCQDPVTSLKPRAQTSASTIGF
jgi:hypothetical protein